jgi:hypothetical protein
VTDTGRYVAAEAVDRIDLSGIQGLGFRPPQKSPQIRNNTPFYGRLIDCGGSVVYWRKLTPGKEVRVVIGPGDLAYDVSWFQTHTVVQTPIAFMAYADPGLTRFVGLAGHVFEVNNGDNGRTEPWVITVDQIVDLEGDPVAWQSGFGAEAAFPVPQSSLQYLPVDLPNKIEGGKLWTQILNASHYRLDGGGVSISPGSVGCVTYSALVQGFPAKLVLNAMDARAGFYGIVENDLWVPSVGEGVRATQIVVTHWNIRRSR